jgi:UDP-N-acetyl-D-galactosamine dehydrogenase
MIYDKLINKEAKLAVIGLGYVGLPIALDLRVKSKSLVLTSTKNALR